MIEKALSPANIQSMLQTLRAAQAEAGGEIQRQDGAQRAGAPAQPAFGQLVQSALGEVNDLQTSSRNLQAAYEKGQAQLTDVVLGMQKSSLAFEATLQVRNKVLKAYEDILNMPV